MSLALLLAGFVAGCFAPNPHTNDETETETETRGMESDTDVGASGTSGGTGGLTSMSSSASTSGGSVSGGSSTAGSTAATASGATTEGMTASTTDGSTTDETAAEVGGPDCGNGRIDGDEECDEGAENGGVECTEVCTTPICGDEIVSGEEACDDGDANGMELGDCAPDCSTLVEARVITMAYDWSQNGDLGGPGEAVAFSDMSCLNSVGAGYKALFSDGVDRRATISPNTGDGQIDWVLRPWTRYIRDDGELVWVTDASALLGVRDGQPMDLLNAINASGQSQGSFTGMRRSWVAHSVDNCADWVVAGTGETYWQGDSHSATAGAYLDEEDFPTTCNAYATVICVEQ